MVIERDEIIPHRDPLTEPLLDHLVQHAEPKTLAAAAVMLRHAFEGGVAIEPDDGMVANVLALIEREIAASGGASMNASDRDPFGLGGTDPLIAMVALRDSIEGQMQVVDLTLPEDEYNATLAVFYDPISKVEHQIGEAVPTSIAGAVALFRFLLDWQEEWQDQEYTDKIIANLIAGLERLGEEGVR